MQVCSSDQSPKDLYLSRLKENIFDHPYASLGKDSRGVFAPARKVSKKYALGMPVIQLNGPRKKTYLAFDIDREHAGLAWEDANLPIPNLIITNPQNGHAHLVWELRDPVWERRGDDERSGEPVPVRYLKAVSRAMTEALGADPAYSGLMVKNPLHSNWNVICGRAEPYTLDDLSVHLDLTSPDPTPPWIAPSLSVGDIPEGCRYVTLFNIVRKWSYRAVRNYASLEVFRDAVHAELVRCNRSCVEPLPSSEIRDLRNKISRWTWKHLASKITPEPNESIRSRQQKGQAYTSGKRSATTLKRIQSAIILLTRANTKLTKVAVAKLSGLNRKTVHVYWEQARNNTIHLPSISRNTYTRSLSNNTDTVTTEETECLRHKCSTPPVEAKAASPQGGYRIIEPTTHFSRSPEATAKRETVMERLRRVEQEIKQRKETVKETEETRLLAKTSIQAVRAILDRVWKTNYSKT